MNADQGATSPELDETDRARADLYALLARLYYRGPDAELLQLIVNAAREFGTGSNSPLTRTWKALAEVAANADSAAAQQDYDDLFVGTGRAEVSPYATFYLAETGREKILVRIRDELSAMGLGRKETSHEPEDHFAGLFDVMRHLVECGSTDAALQDQRRFFGRYLDPSYAAFCRAVETSGHAEFYGPVAVLTRVFLDIESEALQIA